MPTVIRARAPLRLGLAGGGTDVSPYCDEHGGYVLNATIDRYAYAQIELLDHPSVRFNATDQGAAQELELDRAGVLDGTLNLHKAVYREFISAHNAGVPIPMALTTFCDAPVGSGLGASSTLVVAMIRAFSELLNVPLDDYAIANLAYRIERNDCGLQGGRQDQYSATFGGINFMEFYSNGHAVINTLRIKNWIVCELEASLLLYYTGVSRESAKIIADQSKNVRSGLQATLDAMHGLKQEALVMKESLLKGNFDAFVESMKLGWQNKKRLASSISNERLDDIYQSAIDTGALAGKVSGAGGGGFFMFYVPTEKRMNVITKLNGFGGQVSNAHFTKIGTQAWRL